MRALAKTSRFHATRLIQSADGEMFAEWQPPVLKPVGERLYVVTGADLDRPDLIAYRMYGDASHVGLWWLIMWYNQILDPLTLEVGDRLLVPDFKALVALPGSRPPDQSPSGDLASGVGVSGAPPIIRPYVIPPFARIVEEAVAASVEPVVPYAFNYGFLVPQAGETGLHFQMELSASEQFSSIALSKATNLSTSRWYYYSPFANGGSGAHLDFPADGIDSNALYGHPVYFGLTASDGLVEGRLYYVRHRAIINGEPAMWNSPPPFVMRHKA